MLQALLCLLPALALVSSLLMRRYPGERVLRALREAQPPRARWPRARSHLRSRRRVMLALVRGGSLIGHSLAVRPPPGRVATS